MTRYDPHPQAHDDARTTPHGFTTGPSAAQNASGVPEEGGGLREALEALAQEWDSPSNRKDDDQCQTVRHGRTIRAVLAAHPADAPEAPEPRLVPDWVRDGIEGQINAPSVFERLTQAPEPSGDVVADAAMTLRVTYSAGWDRQAEALVAKGLLVDPAETEHRENVAKAWAERWLSERDRARDLAAALESEVARLTEDLERVDACADNMTRLHGQAEAEVERLQRAEVTAEAAQTARERAQREVLRLRSWQAEADRRFGSQVRLTEAAEARARRAEDALREVQEFFGHPCDDDDCQTLMCDMARTIDRALSDPGQTSDATPSDGGECSCARCDPGWDDGGIIPTRLSVCPDCGNKRCPKGTDHDNECTGSNEPGQEGSRYA